MIYFLKIIYIFVVFIYPCNLFANKEEPSSSNNSEVNNIRLENPLDSIIKLIENGKYQESKSLLLERIETIEKDEQAYNLLGYTERQLQNFSSAITYYKVALSINEEYIAAHHYISMAYLEIDQLENAKLHRDYLDLLCLFGCLEFTEVKNAIEMYEKNNVN
tara:strand:- start:21975 stop:22460 length:486 start_codon:yes stop_codon:yes gene_type:complete